MKTGIGQRIREIRTKSDLNQKEFAERVGSSASSISGYELEDVAIPSDILLNIVKEFKISSEWLLLGETPNYLKDEDEKRLVEIYRKTKSINAINAEYMLKHGEFLIKESENKRKEDIS